MPGRRHKSWDCSRCGYSLRGLDESAGGRIICPECGSVQVFEPSIKLRSLVAMPIAACVVINEIACLFMLLAKSTDEQALIAARALPAASLVGLIVAYSLANQSLNEIGLIGRDRLHRLAAVVIIAVATGFLAGAIGCVMIMTLAT